MKKKLLTFFTLCFTYSVSQAINVGPITTIMTSDKDLIAREVGNNTESSRLVALRIQRITSPLSSGEEIPFDQPDEVLSSPANIILPAQGNDIFKIRYNGPADDKERYYRLTWADLPIMDKPAISEDQKTAIVNTRISISTILVVSPRQSTFTYEFKDGTIYNTGNTAFRVTGSASCGASKDCSLDFYLLPGKERLVEYANHKKSVIGIWNGDKFIPVQNQLTTK